MMVGDASGEWENGNLTERWQMLKIERNNDGEDWRDTDARRSRKMEISTDDDKKKKKHTGVF